MKEYLLELAAELRGIPIRIEAHAADPDGRAARACGREYRSLRTGAVVEPRMDTKGHESGKKEGFLNWDQGDLDPTFTAEEAEEMRRRLPLGSGMWSQWADVERDGAAGGEDEVVKVVKGRIKLRSIATGEVVGVRLNPVGLAGDHEVWVS